jgi:hypothetical protein
MRKMDTQDSLEIIKEYSYYCKITKLILYKLQKHINVYDVLKLRNKNTNILKRINLSIQIYEDSLLENINNIKKLDFKRSYSNTKIEMKLKNKTKISKKSISTLNKLSKSDISLDKLSVKVNLSP